jgi:alkylation response protein AidB-like acyl-CoA dehydrogenase
MKTPGVTVRPIIMLDGAHHVNDVFLDNVKVPVANCIGRENEGWTCAKFLLANERLGIAEVPASKRGVRALRELADDPSLREKIADVDLQVQALEMSELRALSAMALGGAPGPEVSTLKVRGSEIQQRIAELAMEAVGEYAAPYQPGMLFHDTNETPVGPDHAPPAAPRYFNMRKTSIYGGSTEVQKNIVSKMVLGL